MQGHIQQDGQSRVLSVSLIEPNPFQPRQTFDQDALEELAASIASSGVLQPVLVRPHPLDPKRYQLVVGERRWRASQLAGLEEIPAIVRQLDDSQLALFSLVENLQRRDLHFMEEAVAYRRILQAFDFTQSELAQHVGKSQAAVANKLRLLSLPEGVQSLLLATPALTERHARALLSLPEDQQEEAAELVAANEWTVKQTEEWITRSQKPRKQVTPVFKDLRIFLNTFRQAVSALQQAGVRTHINEADLGDAYQITVTISKASGLRARSRHLRS